MRCILKKIGVIGIGRVGQAVAAILTEKKYNIVGINDLNESLVLSFSKEIGSKKLDLGQLIRDSEIIIITTPDRFIKKIAKEIAIYNLKNKQIMHMSGSLDSSELNDCKERGAITMSLHPLQSFASTNEALINLPGSYFFYEGQKAGIEIAQELVKAFNGKMIIIKRELKPVYHSAACIASNYLVTLINEATCLMEEIGFDRQFALKVIMPLVKGTIHNISSKGTVKALTGPIARGDYLTIEKHVREISRVNKDLLSTYRMMGLRTVQLLRDTLQLEREKLDKIEKILS